MLVISIIYIFMIKRGKYIIFAPWARVQMISVACARWALLVAESGRRGETFIAQDGGGEPHQHPLKFWQILISNGPSQRERQRLENVVHARRMWKHSVSPISAFHSGLGSFRATQCGLVIGPCKQCAPTKTDMIKEQTNTNETLPCALVCFKQLVESVFVCQNARRTVTVVLQPAMNSQDLPAKGAPLTVNEQVTLTWNQTDNFCCL